MSIGKPYFGQNIEELEEACSRSLREHSQAAPREDLDAFNSNVCGYGSVWAEVCEKACELYVVAGLVGNLSGVPVAIFRLSARDAARKYASDFEAGRAFTLQNDERWCDYVNAASKCKSLNSGDMQLLLSRGRKSGMTLAGRCFTQQELQAAYEADDIPWAK